MSKIEIGLVPYPETTYNSRRFPIKLVEYAARGILILASDTLAHREILTEDIAYFYPQQSEFGLEAALNLINSDIDEANRKIKNAHLWAQRFTYGSRVKGVIQEMHTRNIIRRLA